jgi:hypothetical protein
MSNVEARLASAFLLSVAASLTLTAGPNGAARAADSCITEPKAEAPQGKHWYYRIERGTARHCWYLRGEDEASARTPTAEPVAAAKPAPQTTGNAPPRSLADARAEFAPKARTEDNSTPPARSIWPDPAAATSAAPAAAATTGIGPGAGAPADSQLTSRWPQASGTPSTANAAPQPSLTVADAQADETAATAPAPVESTQVSPPTREVGSLQKLALVALGALALAGITGSLVFRLAGARWRRRRQQRWPQRQPASSPSLADEARGAPWVAPDLSPTVPHEDVAHEDYAHVEHEDAAVDRIEFGKNDDSFEKIEDFLARLTQQLQAELQTTHSTELENPRPQ